MPRPYHYRGLRRVGAGHARSGTTRLRREVDTEVVIGRNRGAAEDFGRLNAEVGYVAAEVREREDGLLDEGVGLGPVRKAVRPGAEGLDMQARQGIHLTLDHARPALVDRAKPDDLASVLAGGVKRQLDASGVAVVHLVGPP
jgi:hypothetical protein